jgi:hypothetical protein
MAELQPRKHWTTCNCQTSWNAAKSGGAKLEVIALGARKEIIIDILHHRFSFV